MATPVPRQCHTAHGGSTETSGGTGGGAGFGYLHKSSCPGRPAAPLGARHVGGGRLPGSCPLSPSPVPCPPPAVQPRGVPSRRRVSQLSSAASEQRRVLDNTPAGRGGLAGVESPRGGKKTHQKKKKRAGGGIRAGCGCAGGTAWGGSSSWGCPVPRGARQWAWGLRPPQQHLGPSIRVATRSCCHPAQSGDRRWPGTSAGI